jgi:hypothetical protein
MLEEHELLIPGNEEQQVIDQIQNGDRTLDRSALVAFHLYVQPTFTDHCGYTLYFPGQLCQHPTIYQWRGSAFVRRVVLVRTGWSFAKVLDQFNLRVSTIKISDPRFKDLIELPASIPITLINQPPEWGLDGSTYGLRKRGFWAGFQLNWWGNGPEAWRELTSWAETFIKIVDARIEEA